MKKLEKHLTRLMALFLLLPLLLCAAFSFGAMAESAMIDPQDMEGVVILEDPALIASASEDLGDVVPEESSVPPASETPTQEPTASPTDEPPAVTQEPTNTPTQEPTDAPTQEPTTAPTLPPTAPPAASYEIAMEVPSGWYLNRAAMEVTVTDAGGTGWTNIRITMGGNTLINGPLPSGHVWLDLLDNCTVEVTVTDLSGGEHRKSETIACFDKTRPSLKASVKGEALHIEASDAQSGVAAVQINGTTYTELENGRLEISLRGYADAYEQLLVQAVDRVGNVSKAIAVANPFFHNPPPTVTTKPTNTSRPTNPPKPTKQPSGGGSSSGGGSHSGGASHGGSRATPTPAPTATVLPLATASYPPAVTSAPWPAAIGTGAPFSDGGNSFARDLLYDRFTNKQFIAIETRGGDVFYMIIDYDKPLDEDGERYETYFLNLVDSRDLLDIVDESLIEPEIVYVTPEPTAIPTQAPLPSEPERNDSGSGSLLGLIGLLALAGGGALWYFKVKNPKQSKPTAFERDYGFDDEEAEEETVNEDE